MGLYASVWVKPFIMMCLSWRVCIICGVSMECVLFEISADDTCVTRAVVDAGYVLQKHYKFACPHSFPTMRSSFVGVQEV